MDNHFHGHQFLLVYHWHQFVLSSILGPHFFLIYKKENKNISTAKFFANDKSIFAIVDDVNVTVMQLNIVLFKISA